MSDIHDTYRKELEASYIAECVEPHELEADPKGVALQAEMFAEGQMGADHEGDCCPVCHPAGARWWE